LFKAEADEQASAELVVVEGHEEASAVVPAVQAGEIVGGEAVPTDVDTGNKCKG
jgi:hypothetical protein